MNKKRMLSVLIVVILALGVFCIKSIAGDKQASAAVGPLNADVNAAHTEKAQYEWLSEYKSILQQAQKDFKDYMEICSYSMYDINKDGTPELLVKTGHCEADFMYNVYTYKDGRAVSCGQFSGSHSSLCGLKDKNGVICHQGQMGYEVISVYALNDNTISQPDVIFEGDVKEYRVFNNLAYKKLTDFSALEWAGNTDDNSL